MKETWHEKRGTNNTVWISKSLVKRKLRDDYTGIHRVLDLLNKSGVDKLPKLVKTDSEYEYQTRLEGDSITRPWPQSVLKPNWLFEVGSWLKKVHLCTKTLSNENLRFIWGPTNGEVINHGDLGPWNILQKNGKFTGLIDWDLARYGNAIDDLTEVAIELCPLRRVSPLDNMTFLPQETIKLRLDELCRGYGEVQAHDIYGNIRPFILERVDDMRVSAVRNIEPFVSFIKRKLDMEMLEDLEYYKVMYSV